VEELERWVVVALICMSDSSMGIGFLFSMELGFGTRFFDGIRVW